MSNWWSLNLDVVAEKGLVAAGLRWAGGYCKTAGAAIVVVHETRLLNCACSWREWYHVAAKKRCQPGELRSRSMTLGGSSRKAVRAEVAMGMLMLRMSELQDVQEILCSAMDVLQGRWWWCDASEVCCQAKSS